MTRTALVLCFTVLIQTIESTSANLLEEFTTRPGGVKPRSHDVINDQATQPDSSNTLDMGAVLCEKYSEWSTWSPCSRKCEQVRVRRCRKPEDCGRSLVKEKRTCSRARGACGPVSFKVIGIKKRNRMIEEFVHMLYGQWSAWGPCTRSCRQKRQRKCKKKPMCVRSVIQEERRCLVPGSKCEHRYSLKPVGFSQEFSDTSKEKDTEISFENDKDVDDGLAKEPDADGKKVVVGGDGGDGGEGVAADDTTVTERTDGASLETSKNEKNVTTEVNKILFSSNWKKRNDKTTRYGRGKKRNLNKLGNEVAAAQKQCGIRPSNASRTYRVVGGQEVMKNSWPWQVAITTRQNEQYCGGTLIAPRWVLTAAHCVRKKGKRRRLLLRVGEHDIGEFESSEELIRPEKEFPHPDFDYQTITNDIALIKLRKPPSAFTETSYACLPTTDFRPARSQLCYIVGWGKLKNTHIYGSDSLMEARVPVVRHKKCQRVFEYDITQNQVCAGYKRGGIDSCAGDSGGPLLCSETSNGTDRYFLYGVTSYGEGCGRKGKYGIYTKVSSYLDWIKDTISQNR